MTIDPVALAAWLFVVAGVVFIAWAVWPLLVRLHRFAMEDRWRAEEDTFGGGSPEAFRRFQRDLESRMARRKQERSR